MLQIIDYAAQIVVTGAFTIAWLEQRLYLEISKALRDILHENVNCNSSPPHKWLQHNSQSRNSAELPWCDMVPVDIDPLVRFRDRSVAKDPFTQARGLLETVLRQILLPGLCPRSIRRTLGLDRITTNQLITSQAINAKDSG